MRKLLAIFSLLLAVTSGAAWAAEDSQCSVLLEQERDLAAKLPVQIDEVTRLVEFSVNCETKVIKFVRHLSVKAQDLPVGVQERKQRQYRNIQCNREGVATHGWTALDYTYDKELQLVTKLIVSPVDCQKVKEKDS
jgi:hypothetical protein